MDFKVLRVWGRYAIAIVFVVSCVPGCASDEPTEEAMSLPDQIPLGQAHSDVAFVPSSSGPDSVEPVSQSSTDTASGSQDTGQAPPCEDQCVIGEEACQGSIHTQCEFDLVVGCAVPVWVEDCGGKGQQCFEAECVDACINQCEAGTVGCQGSVAWFCTLIEGCYKKNPVADCSLVGQQCNEGQCVQDDGSAGTSLTLLCPDMNDCLLDNCENTADPVCMESAFNDVCSPQAESEVEIQNFLAWNGCIQNYCGASQSQGELYGCIRAQCIHEVAECYSGGAYGVAYCDGFEGCAIACPGSSMLTYHKCLRDCATLTSKQGLEVFFNGNYCINEACLDQGMSQACIEEAQYGLCYNDIIACYP